MEEALRKLKETYKDAKNVYNKPPISGQWHPLVKKLKGLKSTHDGIVLEFSKSLHPPRNEVDFKSDILLLGTYFARALNIINGVDDGDYQHRHYAGIRENSKSKDKVYQVDVAKGSNIYREGNPMLISLVQEGKTIKITGDVLIRNNLEAAVNFLYKSNGK